jgi:hypothetical protein
LRRVVVVDNADDKPRRHNDTTKFTESAESFVLPQSWRAVLPQYEKFCTPPPLLSRAEAVLDANKHKQTHTRASVQGTAAHGTMPPKQGQARHPPALKS